MKNYIDQYQNDINDILTLQNLLINLDESNLQSAIQTIKESKVLSNQDDLKVLIRIISRLIKYRKRQLRHFFTLIDEIFPIISSNFTKNEIMFFFSQRIILLKLYYDNYITAEDIITFYGVENPQLTFFYPEIKDILSNNSYFAYNISENQKYKDLIDYFSQNNNIQFNIQNDPRLQIGNTDKLSVLIQKDDIDSFQQMVSQNNINIRNHEIQLTIFEKNKCLKDDKMYLIEYAAYHCAIKIFKFLLMNDTSFSSNLFKYAICGGNSEIIHLSEDKSDEQEIRNEIDNLLTLMIVFHRNELFEYLSENYRSEKSLDEMVSAIQHSNYCYFFNHILELDATYSELLIDSEKEKQRINQIRSLINGLVVMSSGDYFLDLLQIVIKFESIDLNEPALISFNLKDSDPITNALTFSIQKFNNKNAKFLLSLDSVDPDFKLFDNTTPFIWACYVGNFEMVQVLSKIKKVNVLQTVSQTNENALHIATRECNFEIVKFLVSLNAFDLAAQPLRNGTAIQTAARLGYKEIFDFLKWSLAKNGIEVGDDLKVSDDKYYPSRYTNPFWMAVEFYSNIEEPISKCLLV